MTQTTEVPTREPVSNILRQAARLGLKLRFEKLPASAWFFYTMIAESLNPRHQINEPRLDRIAMDTTVTLCAEHAGIRLVPSTVQRVENVIARCFALHDLSRSYVDRALEGLARTCQGGIPVPSLKGLAVQVRDEQIRRDYGNGADYPFLASRHNLTPRRIRQIVNSGRAVGVV